MDVTREWRKTINAARSHCQLSELLRHSELCTLLADFAKGLEGVHKVSVLAWPGVHSASICKHVHLCVQGSRGAHGGCACISYRGGCAWTQRAALRCVSVVDVYEFVPWVRCVMCVCHRV